MSSVQLSFALRVSSSVKTVHLLGSWDNYQGQLPLSKDKTSSKSGSWKGTFRFSGNVEAGQRYWYYYIIDGYHISHNPSEKSTVEPTTGRELNVLDVPKAKSSSKSSSSSSHSKSSSSHKSSSSKTSSSSRHSSSKDHKSSSSSHSKRSSDIPKGRPLSVSQIKSPKPRSPHATRHILTGDYDMESLTNHLAATAIDEYEGEITYGDNTYAEDAYITADYGVISGSPVSSTDGSDLSYSSDDASSQGSSLSGYSTPSSDYSSCTCERYGITRKGDRVRIDCGGSRCGYDDSCSSSDEEEYSSRSSRRNGIVVA